MFPNYSPPFFEQIYLKEMPSEWQWVDITNISNPKQWETISQSSFTDDGYPVYGANGRVGFYSKYNHEDPVIAISCRGACGDLHLTEPFSYVSGNAMCLDGLSEDIEQKFLFYALSYRGLKDSISGSAQPQITRESLKGIFFPLPPLPEQKKIASILTSVDEVIEKTQSQIDKLQDLKKGTMNELLTKGIGHTEFKDSELGRIPKSWEVGRVSDYSSLVTNGFVGSAAQHYRETGIPYLVSKNIRDNFIDERGLTYISKEFHEKTAKSQLRTGDLLTVQSGHVGSTSVVPQKYDGANCHALILTRFDQTLIDAEFVAYYFNSQSGRLRLSDYFVGSTIVHLNTSDLKKFTIPIPELREQKEIIQIVQSIEVQVALWEEKLQHTHSLKKSLMQDLLTGKVRVSVN